jgi:hypothetical protein
MRAYFFGTIILCFNICSQIASAQFTDITSQLQSLNITLTNPGISNGSGVSFYDFNHDGQDDLSLAGGSANPVFLVNNNGTLEYAPFTITPTGPGNVHAMLWIDYDNDGDADLFIAKDGGSMQLWQNDGNFNFTNVAGAAGLEQANYRYTNACFGDYNHDGCPDLYVSKYYYNVNNPGEQFAGLLYRSNCDGTFTNVTVESGVYVPPHMALQPGFVDINNDGWEDLFIAVDRVWDHNELFVNNQDGTFTRISQEAGVAQYIDAMSVAVSDFDHNDYLDIFVTNNPVGPGNLLLSNNGNETFTDVGTALGVAVMMPSWGAAWLDYNNDSWEDLFVSIGFTFANAPNKLFVNNQGQGFQDLGGQLGVSNIATMTFTTAIGDLNNDGYYDIATSNREPFTPRLYQSITGSNNYLSVSLQGTIANRDAIGTWIHCYAGGQHFVRYTMCGEGLSGQNSAKKIFGLGTTSLVDSLVLEWNSGTRETYYNLNVNQHLHYIEGASFSLPFDIAYSGDLFLCEEDSLVLYAGEFNSYLWNNGNNNSTVTIYEPGIYSVIITNQFGLTVTSNPITIMAAPAAVAVYSIDEISCFGEPDGAVLVALQDETNLQSIIWNTGQQSAFIENLESGIYSFIATDSYGCDFTGNVELTSPLPISYNLIIEDVLCYGENTGNAVLGPMGGTPPYSVNWLGQNPDSLMAGNYEVLIVDNNGCEVIASYSINQTSELLAIVETQSETSGGFNGSASISITGGTTPYEVIWSTGEIDVLQIGGLAAGQYEVVVYDFYGCSATINFVINFVSGINSLNESSLTIYPNPFIGSIQLKGCNSEIVSIEITDACGKVFLKGDGYNCNNAIDLSSLENGVYFIRVKQYDVFQVFKLIKTH